MNYSKKENALNMVFEKRVINILIGLGILLPLIQYFYNRSLWVDEAVLVLDIINTSTMDFLKPLASGAVGTILFLLIEKFFSILIPNSEYGLRIFPLFAYLGSLLFFYKILKQTFNNLYTIIFALSLFVFNATLIYFSSEVKPYICDVLAITSIYYVILRKYEKVENKYYLLGIIGTISIFLSFATPIILFSCGIYLGYTYLLNAKLNLKYIASVFLVWAGIFLIYYYFFVYNHPSAYNFKNYWSRENTFMPINPFIVDFYQFHFDKIKMIFDKLLNFGDLSRYVLLSLCLTGFVYLLNKKSVGMIILLILPIFIHLIISAFHLYPFYIRLILYTIPIIIIVAAYGFDYFNKIVFNDLKINRLRLLAFIIPFVIISYSPWYSFPYSREEIKDSIRFIQKNIKKDHNIYVYYAASVPYEYYEQIGFTKVTVPIIYGESNRNHKNRYIDELKRSNGKTWLLFMHNVGNEEEYIINSLDSIGYNKIQIYRTHGSSTYLYDFGD